HFGSRKAFHGHYHRLFSVLAAAREPLPLRAISAVLGTKPRLAGRRLRRIGQLVHERRDRFSLFHRSLADWLQEREGSGEFWCDPDEGHETLADRLWDDYQAHELDEYGFANIVTHLAAIQRYEALQVVLTDRHFMQARWKAGTAHAVVSDIVAAARAGTPMDNISAAVVQTFQPKASDRSRRRFRIALNQYFGRYAHWPAWLRTCLEESRSLNVMTFLAETHDMEGRYPDAERAFRRLMRRAAGRHPVAYCEACKGVAMALDHQDRFQEALSVLDDVVSEEDAEARYKRAYWWAQYHRGILLGRLRRYEEARTVLTQVLPAGRRGLSVSALHQLGVVDLQVGDLAAAEKKFTKCRRRRGSSPYDHRRAYEHRRLGQVYALTRRLDDAASAFAQAIAISRDCGSSHYVEQTERDIVTFLKIAAPLLADRPRLVSLRKLKKRLKADERQLVEAFRILSRHDGEYLEVIDEQSARPTGDAVRWDVAHSEGHWHASVMLLLADDRARVLLQKRGEAPSRGRLDVSVAGHVDIGETDESAAVREAGEEVGIDVDPQRLIRIGKPYQFRKVGSPRVQQDRHTSRFSYVYRTDKRNRERTSVFVLTLSKQEAAHLTPPRDGGALSLHWRPLANAVRDAHKRPARFASAFKQLLHPAILEHIRRVLDDR
ncbi:MAG: NUDIX domain-containing protein, partial [Armatimonadota bacterium]